MSDFKTEFLGRVQDMEQQLQKLRDGLKEPFVKEVQRLMAQVPGLARVEWTQYTPYFNDGDTCVFHANAEGANYFFGDDEDPRFEDGVSTYYSGDKSDPAWKGCLEIHNLLKSISSDNYLTMFGDHAQVTIRPNSVEVDSYDHD